MTDQPKIKAGDRLFDDGAGITVQHPLKARLEDMSKRLRALESGVDTLQARLQKSDGHTPPEGVRSAAARGLELRAKWKRGGITNSEASAQGIGSGVQRATNLTNGDSISIETVRRMAAFFSRHQKNYRPDEKETDGGPTAGTIAWLLWGGNAGKAWANGILARLEKSGPDAGEVHSATTQWGRPMQRKSVRRLKDEATTAVSSVRDMLEKAQRRYPAGSKKGGQFAPKEGGSLGGGATGKKPAQANVVVNLPGQKTIDTGRIISDLKNNADYKTLSPKQRSAVVDVYRKAASGIKDFNAEITQIAAKSGGKPMFPPAGGQKEGTGPLKGVDRALAKIKFDYLGDARKIADLVRATIEVPTLGGAQKAIDYIKKNYEVVEHRSRNFLDPDITPIDGYRDAKFVIRMKTGALAEVQVNVPTLLAAKSKAHGIYEERSKIEREYGVFDQNRPTKSLPRPVVNKIKELNAQMRAIYEPVWDSLKSEISKSLMKSGKEIIQPFRWRDSTRKGRGGNWSQAIQPG